MKQAWNNLQYDYSQGRRTYEYSSNLWFHNVVQQIKNRRNRNVTILVTIMIFVMTWVVSKAILYSIDSHNKIQNTDQNIRSLQEALQRQEWEKSDELTGKLFADDPALTSCVNLSTINRLWVNNSDGKFGLTVQKYIWEYSLNEVTKNKGLSSVFQNDDEKALAKFGNLVGWRNYKENRWLRYNEYNFSASSHQLSRGYFPISWGNIDAKSWNFTLLSKRLNECDIRK